MPVFTVFLSRTILGETQSTEVGSIHVAIFLHIVMMSTSEFWFKIFQTSLVLFPFVSDYDNEYKIMETVLKNFKPKDKFKPQRILHNLCE